MSPKRIIRNLWRRFSPTTRARLVRATQDQFTVSTAAIVLNSDGKVLLLNHVLRPYSGWGFPGGFVEHGEKVEDAVRREAHEEAGIELDQLILLEINTYNTHIEVLWKATAIGLAAVRSAEILELCWFELSKLPAELSDSQRRQIRNAVNV